jgi:hypothetical protein
MCDAFTPRTGSNCEKTLLFGLASTVAVSDGMSYALALALIST